MSGFEDCSIARLLARIEENACSGSNHEPAHTRSLPLDGGSRHRPLLTSAEAAIITEGVELERAAMSAIRAGNVTGAVAALADLEARYRAATLSLNAARFARSQFEAVAGYVDYRKGDFDGAIARLARSLSDINTLVEEEGFAHLEARRVHLAVNWVRVLRRSGGIERAMDTAFGLLSYIEGSIESWPISSCPVRTMRSVPHLPVYDSLVDDLTGEFIEMVRCTDRDTTRFLNRSGSSRCICTRRVSTLRPAA